jgi:hypothetical protein
LSREQTVGRKQLAERNTANTENGVAQEVAAHHRRLAG